MVMNLLKNNAIGRNINLTVDVHKLSPSRDGDLNSERERKNEGWRRKERARETVKGVNYLILTIRHCLIINEHAYTHKYFFLLFRVQCLFCN